jgi:hypothetical protein
MLNKPRIVVSGLIAQYPLGGLTWHYLQYLLGLQELGCDVYYIEDTDCYPYNPEEGGLAKHPTFNVRYLQNVLERFGLGERWAYRFPWKSQWFGMPEGQRQEVTSTADLILNVSGTLAHLDEYHRIPSRVYIDTDPVFTQVKLARGQKDFLNVVDAHNIHFSFGESLPGQAPDSGHDWLPTRQPVVLSEWPTAPPGRDVFTTLMNWTSYNPVEFEGKTYGQKDVEFQAYQDLPKQVPEQDLELALNRVAKKGTAPVGRLRRLGWRIVSPAEVCPDLDTYRSYVQQSMGEWSVAKNGYVLGQSGWFSERSACYLASGRPVVLQDTGFSKVLPVGRGIVPFTTPDEAAEGLVEVANNYKVHSRSARDLAAEYFASDKVLLSMIDRAAATAGSGSPTAARERHA